LEPLFSIVTVTLNCAEDAVGTAKSVLQQSLGDYEYVVKDGVSTDGTPDLLSKMGVKVEIKPDAGIYDAMNQALARCQGEYICFLNAGDVFVDADVLKDLAGFIEGRECRPEVIIGDVQDGRFPGRKITYRDKLSKYYLYRESYTHQACFVKRSLYLAAGGFCTEFGLMADYHFLAKVLVGAPEKYAHFSRMVVKYKFGGKSDGPAVQSQLHAERWAIHQQVFSPQERQRFAFYLFFRLIPLKDAIEFSATGKKLIAAWYRIKGWKI